MHRRVRHLNPAQCGAQIALDARFITGVADGAAVSSWPARANSSITADQGSGTLQPLFRSSAIGGRPAVDFDGSNDYMDLSAASLSLTNNASTADALAVAVQDASSVDANCAIIAFATAGGSARQYLLGRNASVDGVYSLGRRLDADGSSASSSAGAITSASVAEFRARWSSGTHLAAINGVVTASANYGSGSGNTTASNASFARIGAGGAASSRFNGKIAAIVVSVPAFSDAVRRRIRHSLGFSFRIATH